MAKLSKQASLAKELKLRVSRREIGWETHSDPVWFQIEVPVFKDVLQVFYGGSWIDVPVFDESKKRYEK